MKTLHLHLKHEYFDAIERGEKTEEYREYKPYWRKRISGKDFNELVLWRGYDETKKLTLPWKGYYTKTITHPQFGDEPTLVFAIDVSQEKGMPKIPAPKKQLLTPDQHHRLLIVQKELARPGHNQGWEIGVRMVIGRIEKAADKAVRLAFLSWAYGREIDSIKRLSANEKFNLCQWAQPHINHEWSENDGCNEPKWVFAETFKRDLTIITHAFLGVQLAMEL